MKRPNLLAGKMVLTAAMLALLSITLPAWSDAEKKPSIQGAAKKNVSIKEDDKTILDRNDSEKGVKDRSDKGGSTVKKKVVKKTGAAAAAGIAGKKVTSKIKK